LSPVTNLKNKVDQTCSNFKSVYRLLIAKVCPKRRKSGTSSSCATTTSSVSHRTPTWSWAICKPLLWTSDKNFRKHERKVGIESPLLQGEPVRGLRAHDVAPLPESSPTKQTQSGQEVRKQSGQHRQFGVRGSSPGQEDQLDRQLDRVLRAEEHRHSHSRSPVHPSIFWGEISPISNDIRIETFDAK